MPVFDILDDGFKKPQTHYDVLGVSSQTSQDQIKKAYRKMAMKYHPDRNGGSTHAEEMFKKVATAYDVLKDPMSRQSYDLSISFGQSSAAKAQTQATYTRQSVPETKVVDLDIFANRSQRCIDNNVRGNFSYIERLRYKKFFKMPDPVQFVEKVKNDPVFLRKMKKENKDNSSGVWCNPEIGFLYISQETLNEYIKENLDTKTPKKVKDFLHAVYQSVFTASEDTRDVRHYSRCYEVGKQSKKTPPYEYGKWRHF